MKLIVGLGNPGEKYKNSRHNVGQIVLNELLSKLQDSKNPNFQTSKKLKSEVTKLNDLIFAKPSTFMNDSGKAVVKLANFYKVNSSDIWIIHDDLDIKLGQYKIQQGVGPKVHNGVNSIEKELGKTDFWRVRVGIDNREKINTNKQSLASDAGKYQYQINTNVQLKTKISGEDYVLQNFTGEEMKILKGVMEEITGELFERLTINN